MTIQEDAIGPFPGMPPEFGRATPTVHAKERQVKGRTFDDEDMHAYKAYWSSSELRDIAAKLIEAADWLDDRAAAAAIKEPQ